MVEESERHPDADRTLLCNRAPVFKRLQSWKLSGLVILATSKGYFGGGLRMKIIDVVQPLFRGHIYSTWGSS